MKNLTRLQKSALVAAILGIGLASCGDSTSTTRNSDGDAVACVSQSDSQLTKDGNLELHFCEAATSWEMTIGGGDGVSSIPRKELTGNTAVISLDGFIAVKVLSYDASGTMLGIDKITINGSIGGTLFHIDKEKSPVVFYEAAPNGWGGDNQDPKLTRPGIVEALANLNNATAPASDWFFGSESEMKPLFSKAQVAKRAQIIGQQRDDIYWVNTQYPGKEWYGASRSDTAEGGYLFYYDGTPEANSTNKNYVRPIRSFTNGDGPVIRVVATMTAASSSSSSTPGDVSIQPVEETPDATNESTSSTEMAQPSEPTPVPTETTVEPEVATQRDIVNPGVPVVNLPGGEFTIEIAEPEMRAFAMKVTESPVKTAEIQFGTSEPIAISLAETTLIVVPAEKTTAVLRITTIDDKSYEIPKGITRDGAAS